MGAGQKDDRTTQGVRKFVIIHSTIPAGLNPFCSNKKLPVIYTQEILQ